MHDQTVRLISHDLKPAEIADGLALPEGMARRWHARGCYGTLSHNVKAVYQRCLSWCDAHPANLHNLPPGPAGRKYVEYMGGMDALMARATTDFGRGEYRRVAEVMKHAVYAHPEHAPARKLAALAHEQMVFGPSRPSGAMPSCWPRARTARVRRRPPRVLLATHCWARCRTSCCSTCWPCACASRAGAQAFCMAWYFIDKQEHWLLELSNGALNSIQLAQPAPADLSLTTDRPTLESLLQQRLAPMQAVTEGRLRLAGDATLLLDGAPTGQIDTHMVGFNSMISFSGLDIGLDRGSPVSHYEAPFRFEGGKLYKVVYALDPMQQLDHGKIALVELARQ